MDNEIVDHTSYAAPIKLQFTITKETEQDVQSAAEHIDRWVQSSTKPKLKEKQNERWQKWISLRHKWN